MNDLIERLVNAIIRQEGMRPNDTNPGNLRLAPWLDNPTIHNRFWRPASRAIGVAGAAHVVALAIARGRSLTELIHKWAPVDDGNDVVTYIRNVKEWANVPDVDVPLWDFIV